MPRVVNARGVVAEVSEEKAATLAGWKPVPDEKPKRRSRKADADDSR